MQNKIRKSELKINKIGITEDKISGRGGILLFLRYVEQIGFYSLSDKILGHIVISRKGLELYQFIKQMLAYFINGSLSKNFVLSYRTPMLFIGVRYLQTAKHPSKIEISPSGRNDK